MLVLCVVNDVEEDEGDSLLIKASDEISMLPNRIYIILQLIMKEQVCG